MKKYQEVIAKYYNTAKERNIIMNIYEFGERAEDVLEKALEIGLEPKHFHTIALGQLYENAVERILDGKGISLMDLPQEHIETDLVDYSSFSDDCRDVIDLYNNRETVNSIYRSVMHVENEDIAKAKSEIEKALESEPETHRTIQDIDLMTIWGNPEQNNGIPTGIQPLDVIGVKLLGGHLYAIGADTGAGKTTLALNIMARQVTKGSNVLMYSLEQPTSEIYMRLLTILSGYSENEIRTGTADIQKLQHYDNLLKRHANVIDDSMLTTQAMQMRAKVIHQRNPLAMIVVDLWQLIQNTANSYIERLISSADGLLSMAKQLSLPIITIAQVDKSSSRMSKLDRNAFAGSKQLSNNSSYILMLQKGEDGITQLEIVKSRKPGHAGYIFAIPMDTKSEKILK